MPPHIKHFSFKNEDQLNIGVYAADGAASKAGNHFFKNVSSRHYPILCKTN